MSSRYPFWVRARILTGVQPYFTRHAILPHDLFGDGFGIRCGRLHLHPLPENTRLGRPLQHNLLINIDFITQSQPSLAVMPSQRQGSLVDSGLRPLMRSQNATLRQGFGPAGWGGGLTPRGVPRSPNITPCPSKWGRGKWSGVGSEHASRMSADLCSAGRAT